MGLESKDRTRMALAIVNAWRQRVSLKRWLMTEAQAVSLIPAIYRPYVYRRS
jgi:hypothetical protein